MRTRISDAREYDTSPEKRYIYFLFSGDEVVYIGQTIHLETRIRYHLKNRGDKFDSIKYYKCDIECLDYTEFEEIIYHQPKLNQSGSVYNTGYSSIENYRQVNKI